MEKKIGLALSGGGLRGIAHIGVFKVLEERGIQAQYVSGASSGAIMGALYAEGYKADEILEIAKQNSLIKLTKPKLSLMGLSALDGIEELIPTLITHNSFEGLKIPFYASLTDLYHGKNVIFSSGDNLASVIKASCSIPVLFKPVYIENVAYADGGIMNNLPAAVLRDKVDILIGVNLIANPQLDKSDLSSMVRVAMRSFELNVYQNSQESLKLCDVRIHPRDLSRISIFKHKDVDQIYAIGYEAAHKMLDLEEDRNKV